MAKKTRLSINDIPEKDQSEQISNSQPDPERLPEIFEGEAIESESDGGLF